MSVSVLSFLAAIADAGVTPNIVEEIGLITYVGRCLPNCKGFNDDKWLIQRIKENKHGQKEIECANGFRLYNQRWSDRTTLKYKLSEEWIDE